MCEKCDLKNYDKTIYNEPDIVLSKKNGTSLVIELNSNFKEWWLYAYGEVSTCIQIHYCPFCGRKLDEEE